MNKKAETWFTLAKNDLEFAKSIIKNKNRLYYSVHFCHQALEKILKAIIQEHTNEMPKFTHNFKVLWEQGKIPLNEEQKLTLLEIMPHYIGTKYPEDIKQLHKTYSNIFVNRIAKNTEELFKWLQNYLQLKRL